MAMLHTVCRGVVGGFHYLLFLFKLKYPAACMFRDGGTSREVMDQLCDTLRSVKAGSGSVRRALLLALRGVSLTGGSIGGDEASSFRKVRETVWIFCFITPKNVCVSI